MQEEKYCQLLFCRTFIRDDEHSLITQLDTHRVGISNYARELREGLSPSDNPIQVSSWSNGYYLTKRNGTGQGGSGVWV